MQFNETTGRELDDASKRLGENNIKGLVLDLRDNPGGLLNEGVAVADHFLQKGQMIVSPPRPRVAREDLLRASNGNHGHDYPIVVLVNRHSASAAEIVSGALQDHDRAWILGETTFGKGLVQTVYPAVREYRPGADHGPILHPQRPPDPARLQQQVVFRLLLPQGDRSAQRHQDVKMTDSGRTVYGGGGITPDEKYDAAQDR